MALAWICVLGASTPFANLVMMDLGSVRSCARHVSFSEAKKGGMEKLPRSSRRPYPCAPCPWRPSSLARRPSARAARRQRRRSCAGLISGAASLRLRRVGGGLIVSGRARSVEATRGGSKSPAEETRKSKREMRRRACRACVGSGSSSFDLGGNDERGPPGRLVAG